MAGTRNYQSIGEVLGLGQDRVPRHHDLEDPVPRGRGVDRTRAHAVGLPQVLRRRRRPAEVDPADAARRVPAAQGDQGAPAAAGCRRAADGPEGRSRRRRRRSRADAADRDSPRRPPACRCRSRRCRRPPAVERDRIKELESFGIVCSHGPDGAKYYDGDDYIVLSIVKDFFRFGDRAAAPHDVQALRGSRGGVLRGASWRPRSARRTPTLAGRRRQTLADLAVTSRKFKQALLRTNLRDNLQSA